MKLNYISVLHYLPYQCSTVSGIPLINFTEAFFLYNFIRKYSSSRILCQLYIPVSHLSPVPAQNELHAAQPVYAAAPKIRIV